MATEILLAHRWWTILLRGLAAILFGILTFVAPGASLFALVLLFGVWSIVNGVIHLATARGAHWGALTFESIASIVAGVVTLVWPRITALALVLLVGIWAVVTGASQIAAAIRLRREIRGEWLLGLVGALSVAFGVLLFVAPAAGALALVLWIGIYAVVFGALLVGLSLRLRSFGRGVRREVPAGGAPATP